MLSLKNILKQYNEIFRNKIKWSESLWNYNLKISFLYRFNNIFNDFAKTRNCKSIFKFIKINFHQYKNFFKIDLQLRFVTFFLLFSYFSFRFFYLYQLTILSLAIVYYVRTYRRMQQIRKELSRAQSLLQLVVERESLKEVRTFNMYYYMQVFFKKFCIEYNKHKNRFPHINDID